MGLADLFGLSPNKGDNGMKMKMKPSNFGAPVGVYLARFLGVFPFTGNGQPRTGRDGKPMPPAIEWQFEIEEDDDRGGEALLVTWQEAIDRPPQAREDTG